MTRSLYTPTHPHTAGTAQRLSDLDNRINEQHAMAAALQAIGDRRGYRRCKANAAKLADEAVSLRANLRRRP